MEPRVPARHPGQPSGLPAYAYILRGNGLAPWIIAGNQAESEREAALIAAGARVFRLSAGSNGWVDLTALLKLLGDCGLKRLMVEGGAQIISNFLASRLADQLVLTLAPTVVAGLRAVDGSGLFPAHGVLRLDRLTYERLGDDLVVRGDPVWS